jgi:hypothetical protein
MSERKSWDIQPSAPRSRPTQRKAPPEIVRRPSTRESVRRATPTRSSVPLKRRRQLARRRLLIIALSLLAVLVVAVEVVLWQPWFRVATVDASGPGADTLPTFLQEKLSGTRFLIVPKNSIFFLPEKELRAAVLHAYPNVSAVSLSPKGLTTLSVKTLGRASIFWWCGTSYATPYGSCFDTDNEGFIFAPAIETVSEGTSTDTSMLRVYAPVADADASLASPLGAHLQSPAHIPGVTQFVKAMRTLGADVVMVDMRGDEADLYTQAGTRITYVIGKEEEAAALAASGFPNLNLNDGSLLYVDLRFSGKVYFKKRGE